MDLGLNGRVAIVTGGSKGLGLATATALVKEGARVAICARGEQDLAAAQEVLGDSARSYIVDARNAEALAEFVDKVAEDFGQIDILVNNAGGAHPGSPETITDDAFTADFNIKVHSWHRAIRAALPYLEQSEQARVINIGSVYGDHPDPAFFSTSVHRAAGENLTKTWAAHLGARGILVNLVNIGVIETPQWENIRSQRAPDLSMDEFMAQTIEQDIPLGRIGQPDELGAVVTFLASARASYITGSVIDVAGGMGLRF